MKYVRTHARYYVISVVAMRLIIPPVARSLSKNLSEKFKPNGDRRSQRCTQHVKNREIIKKANQQVFNEVRQFAYVLGAREREILLIQQSIQENTEGYLRDLPVIQYRGL